MIGERTLTSFVAIDFETANGSLASICQVGIAIYRDGKEIDTFSTLVNPEEEFWGINIDIHGIQPKHVVSAPVFPEIYDQLREIMSGKVVVSHGWFDRGCMANVLSKYELPNFEKQWLDSTRIVRRALPEFSKKGYGLQNVASHYAIDTVAHDALNDAQTCGAIVLNILRDTSTALEDWIERINQPITPRSVRSSIVKEMLKANEGGVHFGESIVFTGTLSLPRLFAQERAVQVGFEVQNNVTLKTDYLVCGVQDLDKLAGHEMSSKERKALDLIASGHRIKLINETDFFGICEASQ
jgi:DNA polymerase-3 subunit epsilon